MLYVAFTRAKTALYTWSEYGKSLGTVGDLLKMCVNLEEGFSFNGREDICSPLTSHFDEEKQLLEIGALTASEAKVAKGNRALTLDAFKFKDFSAYLRLRKNHENFFEPGDSYDKKINRGRLVHEVLSRIETADQLEQACDELVFKGMMNEEEAGEMTEQLVTLLEDPEVSSWFDGSYRVLNEHNIITGIGYMGVKRPDRIMLSDDEVIVVDYKSGEHESEKYVKQVSEYIEAIEKCGYPNVKGFIWYTRMNKRVRVR